MSMSTASEKSASDHDDFAETPTFYILLNPPESLVLHKVPLHVLEKKHPEEFESAAGLEFFVEGLIMSGNLSFLQYGSTLFPESLAGVRCYHGDAHVYFLRLDAYKTKLLHKSVAKKAEELGVDEYNVKVVATRNERMFGFCEVLSSMPYGPAPLWECIPNTKMFSSTEFDAFAAKMKYENEKMEASRVFLVPRKATAEMPAAAAATAALAETKADMVGTAPASRGNRQ